MNDPREAPEGDLTSGARYGTNAERNQSQATYAHEQGKQHTPMPVRGYKPQSDKNVQLVNEGKRLEAELIAYIAALARHDGVDQRMTAIAKTHIQTGCMWAWRSVFQPSEE